MNKSFRPGGNDPLGTRWHAASAGYYGVVFMYPPGNCPFHCLRAASK